MKATPLVFFFALLALSCKGVSSECIIKARVTINGIKCGAEEFIERESEISVEKCKQIVRESYSLSACANRLGAERPDCWGSSNTPEIQLSGEVVFGSQVGDYFNLSGACGDVHLNGTPLGKEVGKIEIKKENLAVSSLFSKNLPPFNQVYSVELEGKALVATVPNSAERGRWKTGEQLWLINHRGEILDAKLDSFQQSQWGDTVYSGMSFAHLTVAGKPDFWSDLMFDPLLAGRGPKPPPKAVGSVEMVEISKYPWLKSEISKLVIKGAKLGEISKPFELTTPEKKEKFLFGSVGWVGAGLDPRDDKNWKGSNFLWKIEGKAFTLVSRDFDFGTVHTVTDLNANGRIEVLGVAAGHSHTYALYELDKNNIFKEVAFLYESGGH